METAMAGVASLAAKVTATAGATTAMTTTMATTAAAATVMCYINLEEPGQGGQPNQDKPGGTRQGGQPT